MSGGPRKTPSDLIGLAAAALMLAAAALIWLPGGGGPGTVQPSQVQAMSANTLAPLRTVLNDFAPVVTQRPLFHSTRRPYEAPVAAPVEIQVTLTLVGILNKDSQKVALIRLSDGDTLYRVTKGDRLRDWTILDVAERGVVYTEDGVTPLVLRLEN